MSESFQLSLEQKFELRAFADRVKTLSQDEAHKHLVDLYELMIKKESMYKHFLKQEWGLS